MVCVCGVCVVCVVCVCMHAYVCVCMCAWVCVFAIHSFIFEAIESRGVLKEWKSSTAPTHVVLNMLYGHIPFCVQNKAKKKE